MRARVRRKMNPEQPIIIIDTREQMPLAFEQFLSRRGMLVSGDIPFYLSRRKKLPRPFLVGWPPLR